jgi:hypothetical protein
MRVRATFLQHQIEHASYDHEPEEIRDYLLSQLEETNLVLEKIEATPFTEVLS